jgi:uncharacterized protein YneF (UPF0154 family)
MWYVICIFGGVIVGLVGGLFVCRRLSGDQKGGSAPLSPEQLRKIKAILEHIQEGDELVKEIDELLGEKP